MKKVKSVEHLFKLLGIPWRHGTAPMLFLINYEYDDNKCLFNTLSKSDKKNRYSHFTYIHEKTGKRKQLLAHRLNYMIQNKVLIDEQEFVLHKSMSIFDGSHPKGCISCNHLYVGDYQDNAEDRVRDGRIVIKRGEAHGKSKLTEKQILKARKLRDKGYKYKDLAAKFNVSVSAIWFAIKGTNWKHLSK